jgi:tetraacyldisaccharide 4'-kinase
VNRIRRPSLLPLMPLYGAALALKRQMFRLGWLEQRRLANPVISIGIVSAGGAGKTPVVLMMADLLRRRGYEVSILTRGFGRAPKTVERVVPYGDAAWFGDEPVLLAQRSGAPVFVGADRYQAGLLAEQSAAAGKIAVHLLDDGFQHRRLARDLDIVLLTEEDTADLLLPAGNLREPLSTLGEAQVILLREEEAERLRSFVKDLTRNKKNSPAIWVVRRQLAFGVLADLEETGKAMPCKRPLAFCGIARPAGFTAMLRAQSCHPVETVAFADHHPYKDADIDQLLARARQQNADGFVTTEKDAVKLTPEMRQTLEKAGPLVVARLSVTLVDESNAVAQLISLVPRLDRRSGKR